MDRQLFSEVVPYTTLKLYYEIIAAINFTILIICNLYNLHRSIMIIINLGEGT